MADMYTDKVRRQIEEELGADVAKFLAKQKSRLLKLSLAGDVIDWAAENDLLYAMLAPKLTKITVDVAINSTEIVGVPLDQADISNGSLEWIRRYFNDLKKINDKSERVIRSAVADFFTTPGMTRGDLEQMLVNSGLFSPVRASRIAVTETTRAYAQAERIIGDEYRKLGMDMQDIWNTENDSIVQQCPICWPRHDKPRGEGWYDDPPAHVNCRCWLTHRVKRG